MLPRRRHRAVAIRTKTFLVPGGPGTHTYGTLSDGVRSLAASSPAPSPPPPPNGRNVMKTQPVRAALVVLLALALPACKPDRPNPPPSPPAPPPPAQPVGLSASDRETFYHLAEGSEI